MKKHIIVLMTIVIGMFALSACGGGSNKTQTIEFQGITMEIPANWEAEESTLSDDYAIYEDSGKDGLEYQLLLTDTFGLREDDQFDMARAGEYFKEFTEDDATFTDPSDPVAGTFADKYDMHTIDCTYNANSVTKGEVSHPCKLIRVYMGDHDVEIRFVAADGNFEAFDAAIEGAVCD